jgi:hypothetical protein
MAEARHAGLRLSLPGLSRPTRREWSPVAVSETGERPNLGWEGSVSARRVSSATRSSGWGARGETGKLALRVALGRPHGAGAARFGDLAAHLEPASASMSPLPVRPWTVCDGPRDPHRRRTPTSARRAASPAQEQYRRSPSRLLLVVSMKEGAWSSAVRAPAVRARGRCGGVERRSSLYRPVVVGTVLNGRLLRRRISKRAVRRLDENGRLPERRAGCG